MTRTREQTGLKVMRTRELVNKHPSWTRRRVQETLRRQFGSGIRYSEYTKVLDEEMLAGAVGEHRRRRLIKEGFLPIEARAMAGVPITSKLMEKYISERRQMLKTAKDVGMPRKALTSQIRYQYKAEGYYEKGKIQPMKRLVAWTEERYKAGDVDAVARLGKRVLKSLVPRDKQRIINLWMGWGFIQQEALEFAKAANWRTLPLTAPGRRARRQRTQWVNDLLAQGWTKAQIGREIKAYYSRDPSRSPWDFIRRYKPKSKKDFAVYARAAQDRAVTAEARTRKLYRIPVRVR